MGLICNGSRNGFSPFVYRCGALTTIYNPLPMPRNQGATGRTRSSMYLIGQYASLPEGCRHPHVWMMPQKPGRMASRNNNTGSGDITTDVWAVRLALADLVGDGTISSATGGLIVQLVAALTGSGTITSADVKAFLAAVAALTGSGDVNSATATGLGALLADLVGDGTTSGSTATGIGELEADIVAYGDLTPEGLRDAVWNALASQYNETGTMGEKLNDAGSAANPWTEVIESGYTAEQILRLIASAVAGKVSGAETSNILFTGLDGTTTRIDATVDTNGNRTSITLDGS